MDGQRAVDQDQGRSLALPVVSDRRAVGWAECVHGCLLRLRTSAAVSASRAMPSVCAHRADDPMIRIVVLYPATPSDAAKLGQLGADGAVRPDV